MELFIWVFAGFFFASALASGFVFLVVAIAEEHLRQVCRELNQRLEKKIRQRETDQLARMKELMRVWEPEIVWEAEEVLPYEEAIPLDPPAAGVIGRIRRVFDKIAKELIGK